MVVVVQAHPRLNHTEAVGVPPVSSWELSCRNVVRRGDFQHTCLTRAALPRHSSFTRLRALRFPVEIVKKHSLRIEGT